MGSNIILTATGGGHLEQLKQLGFLNDYFNVTYVVADNEVNKSLKDVEFVHDYRNNTFILKYFDLVINFIQSYFFLLKYKPEYVISTGSGSSFALCYLQKKIFKKKVIFIESFAKRYSGTRTGMQVYKFADYFIVQWKELLDIYPNAIYGGMIY